MNIQLNLTAADLEDEAVRNVLLALAGQPGGKAADVTPLTSAEPVEEVQEAPAKPAAKPRAGRKPAAKKAAPKVEEPVEEEAPAEEPVAEETEPAAEASNAATPKDAISRATKLVSSGKTARVKAVLSELGAKKVSDLKGAKLTEFIQMTDEDVAA